MGTYFRLRLSNVPDRLEEVVSIHCFDHGASGLSEALSFRQPDLTYDPVIAKTRKHDLDVFFPQPPPQGFFDRLREIDPGLQWQVFEEEEQDWLAEWKKGFKSFRLTGPHWIVPSWETPPEGCTSAIRIDPGMAFGTGTHATTQMMSFFLHRFAQQNKEKLNLTSLLDVGTGTGILAILAAKEGFGKICAVEIDPEARRVAKENFRLNGAEHILIYDCELEEVHDLFDVVVANIIDGVLIKIKAELLRVLKTGGDLFVTGILHERDEVFFREFIESSNLKVQQRLEKDEWVGYWLRVKK
ncbi:MAG: 50S ribosomal protein L11 methyltransferase [Bdellovibrionaceae bacterium]|nr:50S ribosomal protein L11 methyltransferase [Pseudobdellovibrionaceae bacterium]